MPTICPHVITRVPREKTFKPGSAWRNRDVPGRIRPGEDGFTPLALNLFYLLTLYAENDSELIGHVLLGTAMHILHDHSLLSRAEVRSALALSELDAQIEQVVVRPKFGNAQLRGHDRQQARHQRVTRLH